jgi:hypothetical protein
VSPSGDPAAFLAARAGPVVNVKTLMTMRMAVGGESRDREVEAHGQGTVVDPAGLVVLPLQVLGDLGNAGDVLRQMGITLSVEPKEVTVVVGGDGVERRARIVARDSVLGLGYVYVVGDEGKPLPAVDLTPPAAGGPPSAVAGEPAIGERLYAVGRKTEAFDRVPLLLRFYATQRLERPRRLWGIVGDYEAAGLGSMSLGFLSQSQFVGGTPAYDASGRVVGLLSQQTTLGAEGEAPASVDAILPLDAVARSIAAAKRVLPSVLEEEKAREAEAAAPAPAPKEGAGAPGGE